MGARFFRDFAVSRLHCTLQYSEMYLYNVAEKGGCTLVQSSQAWNTGLSVSALPLVGKTFFTLLRCSLRNRNLCFEVFYVLGCSTCCTFNLPVVEVCFAAVVLSDLMRTCHEIMWAEGRM